MRVETKNSQLLIYLGSLILVFLCGAFLSVLAMRWWSPSPSTIVFATATLTPLNRPPVATAPLAGELAGPGCAARPGHWQPYLVQPGDTLSELAHQSGVSQESLIQANCLTSPALLDGQTLYLPPIPTSTPCSISASPGWTSYTVQAGDTLFTLAADRGVDINDIIRLNCLSSSDLTEGQHLYLPSLPTPTPCLPVQPAGWGLYLVQSGDTLYSLAAARNVTVAELLQVNCLTDLNIQAGQQLYLPLLPTPTPTDTPPPTPTSPPPVSMPFPQSVTIPPSYPNLRSLPAIPVPPETTQPVSIVDIRDGLPFPPLAPAPGGPNEPSIEPCKGLNFDPWIDKQLPGNIEPGERAYFYACLFKDKDRSDQKPLILTAQLVGPNGTEPLDVQLYPPNPELSLLTAQGVAIWNALCDAPLGPYTLTIEDNQGTPPVTSTFTLTAPTRQRILTIPQTGAVGTTFRVYYCNYTDQANQEVVIDLYYAATRLKKGEYAFYHATSWNVPINRYGWAVQVFSTSPSSPAVPYLLQNREAVLKGWDIFWLIR